MKHKARLFSLFLFAVPLLAGFSSPSAQKDQSKESPWWGWVVLILLILLIVLWIMWVLSKKEKPVEKVERVEEIPQVPAPEPIPAETEAKFDDLKVIEGIGPKIEKLLHEAGIRTYKDLASADIETLKEVLEKAGSRFRLADPTTWPRQAALAAEGKWDGLKELQNSLKGGREV